MNLNDIDLSKLVPGPTGEQNSTAGGLSAYRVVRLELVPIVELIDAPEKGERFLCPVNLAQGQGEVHPEYLIAKTFKGKAYIGDRDSAEKGLVSLGKERLAEVLEFLFDKLDGDAVLTLWTVVRKLFHQ